MKKLLLLLLVLFSISGFSQALNNYKYAIVPAKFSFFKNVDQYQLNAVTKLYLESFGFIVYYDTDILPFELLDKNCNKLFVDAQEGNTSFSTKIKINFKDCKNTILYASEYGISKEKEDDISYKEAFRMALKSIASANYKYQEKKQDATPFEVKKELTNAFDSLKTFAIIKITNGFNVIDDEKQIIYKALKTSSPDLYLAQGKDKNGVFIKKGEKWFFEYYKNEKLQSEEINILTEIEVGK